MGQQFDFIPGIDLSGLEEVSREQLLQAFEQMYPYENLGLVIKQTEEPDVDENARFKRYLWVDNTDEDAPVLKRYNEDTAAWEVFPVSANAVINTSIADGSVTYNTKIGGFVVGDALKLVRVNAAGTVLEVVTFNSDLLPSIALSKLTATGAGANKFLKWNNAGSALGYEDFDPSIITAGAIALGKLASGSAAQYGYLLRANPTTGVIELVVNNDLTATNGLFAQKSIRVDRLDVTGAAAKYGLRYNSSTGLWATEKVMHQSADTALTANSKVITAEAHGLGGAPDNVALYAVCSAINHTATHGYVVGDVIPAGCLFNASLNVPPLAFKLNNGGLTFDVGFIGAAGNNIKLPAAAMTGEATLTGTQFIADFKVRAVLTRNNN